MTKVILMAIFCPIACVGALAQDASEDPATFGRKPRPRSAPIEAGAKMVQVDVLIVQTAAAGQTDGKPLDLAGPTEAVTARIHELEKQGQLQRISRVRLATLEHQAAFVQFGERRAVVTGRITRPGGPGDSRTPYAVQQENVGTMVGLTPVVSDDGDVVVELDVEESRLDDSVPARSDSDDKAILPPRTRTTVCRSTVRIPPGQMVVAGGMQAQSDAESACLQILVTATILSP